MLDRVLLRATRTLLERVACRIAAAGISAEAVSWAGFVIGLAAVPLIVAGANGWALACIAGNRIADGLDGAIARLGTPTDRGAFLDIALDFLFYSAIPLAFAIADPQANALAAATLIYAFVGTGSSFLTFAVLAAKRGLASTAYPGKGFYYLGGLTEASETVAVFAAMCLWPNGFAELAYGFAALCALTTATRIHAGLRQFGKPD